MKKIILFFLLILFCAVTYIALALFVSDYKKSLSSFTDILKFEASDLSNIKTEITFSPFPVLVVKEAKIKNKIEIYNAELSFDIISILKFQPIVNSVNAQEVKIFVDHSDIDLLYHTDFIAELIDKDAINLKTSIQRLELAESQNLQDNLVINNFIFDGISQTTNFKGDLNYIGRIEGYFKEEENNKFSFNLSAENEGFKIKLYEIYSTIQVPTNSKNDPKIQFLKGNVEIKTKNIISLISKFIPDINQLHITKDSNEELSISLNMQSLPDGSTHAKDIIIKSESIDGTGEIFFNQSSNNSLLKSKTLLDLKFQKIDIDKLSQSQKQTNFSAGISLGEKNYRLDKRELETKIFVKELTLGKNNKLSNIDLNAKIEKDKFVIQNFLGNIGENGTFKIEGNISQNNFRKIFDGNIAIADDDLNNLVEYIFGVEYKASSKVPFKLSSYIKMSSVDLSLQNITLNTPSSDLSGNLSAKFIGESPRINANLNISEANLDKDNFPGLKYILSYTESLGRDTKNDNYLAKFTSIRNINSIGNFNISLNSVILNNTLYEDIKFGLYLLPGELYLNNLRLYYDDKAVTDTSQKKKNFIDLSLELKARGINPIIKITLNDGSIGISSLQAMDIFELRDYIKKNIDLNKFQLSLQGYLSEVYDKGLSLGRILVSVDFKPNIIDIKKFDTDIFKGRIKSSGSVSLDPLNFNFVYGISSLNIGDVYNFLNTSPPKDGSAKTDAQGALSASGMITTNGKTKEELRKNLYTKSSIITKSLVLQNFSIDNLVLKVNKIDYKPYNLDDDIREAILTGSTEISDLKSDIELNEGIMKASDIQFKTKYSAGVAAAAIDIYNMDINLNSKISFLINPTLNANKPYSEYIASRIDVNATGNISSPKKTSTFDDLRNIIQQRKK